MSSKLLEPGSRLGKYEVVAHIATGGMGAVYQAVDAELGRSVALKVLQPELAHLGPVLERFRREARHSARLNHPNIVALHEIGHDVELDLHYLVLEYISGIDLKAYIEKRGTLHPEEARLIMIQAATALNHAHEHGLVHRDIKPSNFLLARVGNKVVIKLTDLGLARRENDDDYRVTREGTTIGTVDYMAPEQARDSGTADIRSDIYSLGCTAYHMLAGKPPFSKGGLGERLVKHLEMPPPDVRFFNPKVSSAFWAILEKMLAKKPDDRYATPADLLRDLKTTAAEAGGSAEEPSTILDVAAEKTTVLEALGNHTPKAETPPAPPPVEEEPAPEPPRRRRRKKRHGELTKHEDAKPSLNLTADQAKTAASYHAHAVKALNEGRNDEYVRELLIKCLAIDPFNLAYRQTLRDTNHKASGGLFKRWFGSINILAIKSKLKLARSSGNWLKVLELGEDILAQQPADGDTHVEMAAAAQELGLPGFAKWLLDKGREQTPDHVGLMRATALLYEEQENWKAAVSLWEKVQLANPDDNEVGHKINTLLAKDHISQHRTRR